MPDRESIWAPPQRAFRAAVAFVGHLILGLVLVTGTWIMEQFFHWLWGEKEPLLYGRIPLKWLFDTVDMAILGVFIVWGAVEAHRKLKG
jgi:hypothetical protein